MAYHKHASWSPYSDGTYEFSTAPYPYAINTLADFDRHGHCWEAGCCPTPRDKAEKRFPCGVDGFVGKCPGYPKRVVVGEDNAIYAVAYGSIHDPRYLHRACSWKPRHLCCGPENDLQKSFKRGNLQPAGHGPGYNLKAAYTSVF